MAIVFSSVIDLLSDILGIVYILLIIFVGAVVAIDKTPLVLTWLL